jgi:dTDP-4-amino-4,6-dideoxygalactose transaminase
LDLDESMSKTPPVPFNKPHWTGAEFDYIEQTRASGHLSGDGPFTKRCNSWLEAQTGAKKALLTHSCTGALEMAAMLTGVGPGDEVIMPSYTFVSTANAFVLRGATPVFIDVRSDTLNMDENLVEAAITPRTRAIAPVHYAGVGCEMDAIMDIARRHDLLVVEDAAQGIGATYRGQALGAIGQFGCLSFHETKNIVSGEGGALLINDERFCERAEILREKGTNRSKFFRGEVDKYTWVDIGSSYLPSELVAAFLYAQLERAREINAQRIGIWNRYHAAFAELERRERVRRPIIPLTARHNAHMYYLLLPDLQTRSAAIGELKRRGISAVFHYVPLHSAPAGVRFGRVHGSMQVTDDIADRLLRLPLWPDMASEMDDVCEAVHDAIDAVL